MCQRTHFVYACGHTTFHSHISCNAQTGGKEESITGSFSETICSEYQQEIEIPEEKDCEPCVMARNLESFSKLVLGTLIVVEEVEAEAEC
ncbi:hypothetical protein TWF730_000047 [Orbilia blumenaviensis]|uniref:Uncharacterized protein n=1 Tax=Orbilia blumenaviensis TaxID=1796055 RepID=A0AAV9VN69_9PEZI